MFEEKKEKPHIGYFQEIKDILFDISKILQIMQRNLDIQLVILDEIRKK